MNTASSITRGFISATKSGRRAVKRDREGNCRRETEIAVMFTMKIPLVSFSRPLMSYDVAIHTIRRTGDRVLRRGGCGQAAGQWASGRQCSRARVPGSGSQQVERGLTKAAGRLDRKSRRLHNLTRTELNNSDNRAVCGSDRGRDAPEVARGDRQPLPMQPGFARSSPHR